MTSPVLDVATAPAWRHPAGLPASLRVERTLIMGILNTTPDSFSDGGLYASVPTAIQHSRELIAAGADLIDVGGESTRPGAERVDEAEELRRTIPVIRELAGEGIVVSIDTMRASVAAAAVEAGAVIVNDVSAGLADPDMLAAVASARTALGTAPVFCAMHWRAHSHAAMDAAHYDNVALEVERELVERIEAALEAGIAPEHLVVDPGFGFSKDAASNWELLRELPRLEAFGYPLLVGVSRKRFVRELRGFGAKVGTGSAAGVAGPEIDADAATAAISGLCQARRTWAVRVHDPAPSLAAIRVAEQLSTTSVTPTHEEAPRHA